MADPKKRLPTNVPGPFFVDDTCINCDTCRQLAPDTFAEKGEYSCVYEQPENNEQWWKATRALLACPTGSIGCTENNQSAKVMNDFPLPIEDNVYYCGFNSPKSYGGNSYFIQDPSGNWLIDSPKYVSHLINQFEKDGGIKYIFLTHKDDVADAARFAKHFGAETIIHRGDVSGYPDANIVIDGDVAIDIQSGYKIIPTPGHTRGHCVLLYKEKFLFTGDHLEWNRDIKHLDVFEDYCWYDFREQLNSVDKLNQFRFVWILHGHGQRIKLTEDQIHGEIDLLVRSRYAHHHITPQ
jgi:glyoxylase-like metal-dependent hydrolase (beta-lactamase superfamily II)/ferredoxin